MTADEQRQVEWATLIESCDNAFETAIEYASLRAEVGDGKPLQQVIRHIERMVAFYNERAAGLPLGPELAQA